MTNYENLILDNPTFNVKGQGRNMLLAALELGMACTGQYTLKGYRVDETWGIILYWADTEKDGYQKFLMPCKAEDIVDILHNSLQHIELKDPNPDDETEDDEVEAIHYDSFDRDVSIEDGDISTEPGWRLYTDTWGHIDDEWQACLALRPSYLWAGK